VGWRSGLGVPSAEVGELLFEFADTGDVFCGVGVFGAPIYSAFGYDL
jgi:hypothetical protein